MEVLHWSNFGNCGVSGLSSTNIFAVLGLHVIFLNVQCYPSRRGCIVCSSTPRAMFGAGVWLRSPQLRHISCEGPASFQSRCTHDMYLRHALTAICQQYDKRPVSPNGLAGRVQIVEAVARHVLRGMRDRTLLRCARVSWCDRCEPKASAFSQIRQICVYFFDLFR